MSFKNSVSRVPPWARTTLFGLIGAGVGLLYWWKVGCVTGGCPMTSNVFLTTGLGLAAGLSLGWPSESSEKPEEAKTDPLD